MDAIKSYDYYGDFASRLFFANKYNKDSSKVSIYLDVEETRNNFNEALRLIDLKDFALVKHICKWTKSKNKDYQEDDYIYFATYYSNEVPLCIELELNNDELTLECYYEWENDELQQWSIDQVDKLRDAFGTLKTPEFHILTSERDNFETTKIKINAVEVDIDLHYNDSFKLINEKIKNSFIEEKSGLIILYGKPGTGKTTYIKNLVQIFNKNKFIFIPNDFISDLLKPSFVSFLARQINSVLVIEDAEKVITNREQTTGSSVVSTLLQLTDGLFSDYLKIKVICTFNTKSSKIDKALFRKGRMIASYEFEELSIEKVSNLINVENLENQEPMTIGEIFNKDEIEYDLENKKQIGFNRS